ncbi:hypothetical protein CFIMG_002051RA [Ceratocystis fimbriata CBS 114723]|uniref:Zona occludens toxin N-terminal domain-containing protein n=1 Tax=Ceratocystis fimbriata CBS 114723 TaxID=1035309 RepID=A0A2C5WWV5_9PEZI|nr:hypothetical protein CFIMG_002051RA [Ceratocystis fimbriata CBS 114723]
MARFHAEDLQAHMELLRPEGHSEEVHDVVTAPLFTEHVGKSLLNSHKGKSGPEGKALPQYGLLGCDISTEREPEEPARLFYNVAAPSSVFICGSQGSGKSHTLATLLENCLVQSAANVLTRPLAGLVFHYDLLASDSGGLPCEAAYLSSNENVKVRVLCPPTNTTVIKKIYASLPKVSVQELRFSQDNLNTKRMLNLMVASSGGRMPLYLHTVMRILRELRISQQQRGGAFNYQEFKNAIKAQPFTKEQSAPLQQRLETLESFMVKQDTRKPYMTRRYETANSTFHSVKDQGAIDWTSVGGQLTIIDLSCPCVTAEQACSLFDICLSLFLEQNTDLGRVIALDESHKYMNETDESKVFTESLLSAIRLQRHNGSRIIISTQEPTVSPNLLDLCSITIVHRFTSPVWFQVLRRHLAGAFETGSYHESGASDSDLPTSEESQQVLSASKRYQAPPSPEFFSNIVQLRTGEAFLFAPSGMVNATARGQSETPAVATQADWQPVFLGHGIMKVRIRNRITVDGGKSIIAQ